MFWVLEAIFRLNMKESVCVCVCVCVFQCCKMDEIRHHRKTTVSVTQQTLHNLNSTIL